MTPDDVVGRWFRISAATNRYYEVVPIAAATRDSTQSYGSPGRTFWTRCPPPHADVLDVAARFGRETEDRLREVCPCRRDRR